MTVQIFGNADIAVALGVSRAAVSNWLSRHTDSVPTHFAETPDGIKYWDLEGLKQWIAWHNGGKIADNNAEARRKKNMAAILSQIEEGE